MERAKQYRIGKKYKVGILKALRNNTSSLITSVFVRNLVLNAKIGVHSHEKRRKQPVRINVKVSMKNLSVPKQDSIDETMDYEKIVDGIRKIVKSDHINLVESLAEKIAELCLSYPKTYSAIVKVEKLQIIAEAESVGVEIKKKRT
tara:strand:- start:71 stop:508 length:438 start_codon:yes stop_codon:yes gene_type:complete